VKKEDFDKIKKLHFNEYHIVVFNYDGNYVSQALLRKDNDLIEFNNGLFSTIRKGRTLFYNLLNEEFIDPLPEPLPPENIILSLQEKVKELEQRVNCLEQLSKNRTAKF